jgi:DNA-nicking Smr family endonuclease
MKIISEDEKDKLLFQRTVGRVTPVKVNKIAAQASVLKPLRINKNDWIDDPILERDLSAPYSAVVTGEATLWFSRIGISEKQLRQLRKGSLPIEAECDLHLLTQAEAEQVLTHFIYDCTATKQYRVVKIIHGKGHRSGFAGPLLKNLVNQRLREYPAVLAFCSAVGAAGGSGAVCVLLKAMTK